jgi:hypothetical protein
MSVRRKSELNIKWESFVVCWAVKVKKIINHCMYCGVLVASKNKMIKWYLRFESLTCIRVMIMRYFKAGVQSFEADVDARHRHIEAMTSSSLYSSVRACYVQSCTGGGGGGCHH